MPNIAAAVRRKNGQSTTYLPSELPDAIDAISTTPDASSPVNTTINPGGSASVPAGYYEEGSTINASLADTANEIASSLKSSGLNLSVRPGQSAVVGGGMSMRQILQSQLPRHLLKEKLMTPSRLQRQLITHRTETSSLMLENTPPDFRPLLLLLLTMCLFPSRKSRLLLLH